MSIAEVKALAKAGEQMTPCEAWTALFRLRENDAKRWAFAAFVVGMAAALALVAAIIAAVIGQKGPAIASGIGTIVSGAATAWLWARRTEVQKEAAEFLQKVKGYCSP